MGKAVVVQSLKGLLVVGVLCTASQYGYFKRKDLKNCEGGWEKDDN